MMTECERIVAEGKVPADFLKEEIRDEYRVEVWRKKVWMVELDLMLEYARICEKHGFRYWLCAGSLLGAVRHRGFIPWDDDIDILMMREEYDEFIKLSQEFKHPYFLQTPQTDPAYFYSFAKIRNSNTSAISEMFRYQPMNHGISLDVYPLEDFEETGYLAAFERIERLNQENSTYMRMTNPTLDEANRARVAGYSGRNPMETYEEIQRVAQYARGSKDPRIAQMLCTVNGWKRNIFFREDFAQTALFDFEMYRFPGPAGFDRQLQVTYGDYMKLPPVEKRGAWHSGELVDADVPYRQLLKERCGIEV